MYRLRQKDSINRSGYFQGDLQALEVALKDSERHADGRAYYDCGGGGDGLKPASKPFACERCFDCHRQNAEDDNVFVQFYPVMRRVRAERKR